MTDDSRPIPPRFRWLKRLLPLAVLFVLAVVALRVAWGYRWSQRLAEAEAAVRTRGEPLRIADLQIDPVPDTENRAYYLQQALLQWPRVDGQLPGSVDAPYGQDPPEIIHDNAAYLASCEPVFNLLREAATKERCSWGTQYVSPAINVLLPHFGTLRELARATNDAAARAHAIGDDRLALELLSLLPPISQAAEIEPGFLIGRLVAISIEALLLYQLEDILPTLRVSAEDPRAAHPDQLRALIAALLDEARHRERDVNALVFERLSTHDTAMSVVEGSAVAVMAPTSSSPVRLLFGPLLRRDVHFMLAWLNANVHATRHATSDEEHRALLDAHGPDMHAWDASPNILRPLSGILLPALDASRRTKYRYQGQRRLTAAALAIKLYEMDHGRRPASLDELVPRYLPHLPLDPYTIRGSPMRYVAKSAIPKVWTLATRNDPDSWTPGDESSRVAVLYFDGPDGRDDAGLFHLDNEGDIDQRFWEFDVPVDHCYLLDAPRLPGADHQPPVEQAPGH